MTLTTQQYGKTTHYFKGDRFIAIVGESTTFADLRMITLVFESNLEKMFTVYMHPTEVDAFINTVAMAEFPPV